jgi:hypothetical protein
MKYKATLKWLVPIIFFLALAAALAGVWPGEGAPYNVTNFRGEEVTINNRGLYTWDTVSSAAQMQANDLVMLVIGLPLLAVSFWLALRGSLRGHLLMTGTLGFILYTYITMCFGAAYNAFFLVYVALFSTSLFAFILSMMSFDMEALLKHFSKKIPHKAIAGLLFFTAAFLTLAWLGRIAPTILEDQIPALENTTSMFIQAMDLGIIVPFSAIAGILLLRRTAWGYLLTAVGLMKFLTMGAAVSLMGLNMARVGVPVSIIELVVFPTIALVNLVMVIFLLKGIKDEKKIVKDGE